MDSLSDVVLYKEIQSLVEQNAERIIDFLREIIAIPSMQSQIKAVGERIAKEMQQLGFEEIRFDVMGNIMGKIGRGDRIIVYDSHIDTVDIGNPGEWAFDPFKGKVENNIIYGRGACDEKGSTPGMIYGLAFAKKTGVLEDWTAYYFGNMEEWCDGIAPKSFVEIDPKIRPDYVVIGEPTKLQVYRGHKGRIEMKVVSKGRSAHAASNHLGDNAIYSLLPVITGIRDLETNLANDEFLGHGKITVTDMKVETPSINAVPNLAEIFIDRRLTFGETKEQAISQVESLIPADFKNKVKVEPLVYQEPSYTGFTLKVEKYFPAWAVDQNHPLVQSGLEVRRLMGLPEAPSGKWEFSTNGVYWAGRAGIPCIGFGPGDETTAHTVRDCVPISELVKATEFYSLLPGKIKSFLNWKQE